MSTARLISTKSTREDQDDALDQRQVAIDDRVDRHVAEAFIGEQRSTMTVPPIRKVNCTPISVSVGSSGVLQRLAQDDLRLAKSP